MSDLLVLDPAGLPTPERRERVVQQARAGEVEETFSAADEAIR